MEEQIEIERRWLLIDQKKDKNYFDKIHLSEIYDSSLIKIYQFYLEPVEKTPGLTERLRQSVFEDGSIHFEWMIKTPAKVGQLEKFKEIDKKEFGTMLSRLKRNSKTIIKHRYVFKIDDFKYELDQFLNPIENRILEVELPSYDTEIKIPEFFGSVFEITKEKNLSNYKLSTNSDVAKKIIADLIRTKKVIKTVGPEDFRQTT